MEIPIKARVSNRHVHLTKEVYDKLFDGLLEKRNDLSQIGEYATTKTMTIRNGEKSISNVRLVGPLRNYNQIEISKKDARLLDLNPPVRRSGDLSDSLNITLETDKGKVEVKGLVIANRHIHMNETDAKRLGVKDKDILKVRIDGVKSGVIDAEVKVTSNGVLELHIDTDDANAFLIEDYDEVTLKI